MPEAIDNLYRVLNDLIAACRDAEEGYGKAAKGVPSDELRDLLTRYSRQRADFADELESLTRNQGRAPETTGHIGGVLTGAGLISSPAFVPSPRKSSSTTVSMEIPLP